MSEGFGKYEIYAVAESIYCYRASNVLRNKFGIRDSELLKKIEADISAIRQTDMLRNPIRGRFTSNHLCNIHRYLLGDVYAFAGNFRREDIAKGETRFLDYREIKAKLASLLLRLHAERMLSDLDYNKLVERSAYYLAELNYIHPFREGNGRASREFMRQLFDYNSYEVDWSRADIESLQKAMIESVYDIKPLTEVLQASLKRYNG